MAVSSVHPLYSEHIEDWIQLRDAAKGERAVKEKGQTYLPPTSGMILDGLNGPYAGSVSNPSANNGAGTAGLGSASFGKWRCSGDPPFPREAQ